MTGGAQDFCSIQLLNQGAQLAERVLALEAAISAIPGGPELVAQARAAAQRAEEMTLAMAEHAAEIEQAREQANDELEIDDRPIVSGGEDGVWVNAWIYVAKDGD